MESLRKIGAAAAVIAGGSIIFATATHLFGKFTEWVASFVQSEDGA